MFAFSVGIRYTFQSIASIVHKCPIPFAPMFCWLYAFQDSKNFCVGYIVLARKKCVNNCAANVCFNKWLADTIGKAGDCPRGVRSYARKCLKHISIFFFFFLFFPFFFFIIWGGGWGR